MHVLVVDSQTCTVPVCFPFGFQTYAETCDDTINSDTTDDLLYVRRGYLMPIISTRFV